MEQGQPYIAERAHGQLLGEDLIADPSDIISANNYIVNIIPLLQNMQPMSPVYFTSFTFLFTMWAVCPAQ
jgi:hypothetical protein